ncbi:DUF6875 domain-containing protein [Nocardia sp. NPDC003482]
MNLRLREPEPEVARALSRWLTERVGRPHPDLGRDGPICPFVLPARKAGALTLLEHPWRGPHEAARMAELIVAVAERFESVPGRGDLDALLVVVTGLPREAWWLIDEGHRQAKTAVVERGLMVGQFHPDCRAPSVHNPLFAVNTAPYPLFALRRMAVHDILFLAEDPRWFRRYRELFGHRFTPAGRVGEPLRAAYARACRIEREASWMSS